jgi:alkylation response protein AidB-like acyl-CoA dehydrogenase
MDLKWSATDLAFADEVRGFLEEKLTAELRQVGRLTTSVCANHDASLEWQRILHERGWAAPAWPVAYGGCDWNLTHH